MKKPRMDTAREVLRGVGAVFEDGFSLSLPGSASEGKGNAE